MSKEEEIKCNSIKSSTKRFNLKDYITEDEVKQHNPNWPQISDLPYGILIDGSSRSGKTNASLNLISC